MYICNILYIKQNRKSNNKEIKKPKCVCVIAQGETMLLGVFKYEK